MITCRSQWYKWLVALTALTKTTVAMLVPSCLASRVPLMYIDIVLCGSFFDTPDIRVMIQGVITTPSMRKHFDGFGRTTFYRYVLHTSSCCFYALCAHLYLVSYSDHPSTLQEECLGIYETNALMTRPASYVVMHTCTQLSCTRKLGLEGVWCGRGEFF